MNDTRPFLVEHCDGWPRSDEEANPRTGSQSSERT